MTPRQEKFVEFYLITLNGAEAARRAGFSRKTAKQIAYDLLRNAEVAAAVERGIEQRTKLAAASLDPLLAISAVRAVYDASMTRVPIVADGRVVGFRRANLQVASKQSELLAKMAGMLRDDPLATFTNNVTTFGDDDEDTGRRVRNRGQEPDPAVFRQMFRELGVDISDETATQPQRDANLSRFRGFRRFRLRRC